MRNLFKRITSFVTALAMTMTLTGGVQLVSFAEDNNESVWQDSIFLSAEEYELSDDELLLGYFENKLYGIDGGISTFAIANSTSLTGNYKIIYDAIYNAAKDIAAGSRDSSVVSIPDLSWKYTDLKATDFNTANNNLSAEFNEMFSNIYSYLLSDNPYEFYWHKKSISTNRYTVTGDGTNITIEGLEIYLSVGKEYAGTDAYTVDTSVTSAASAAAANAQAIVNSTSGTDFERLTAYKNKICSLVSYDSEAVNHINDPAYGVDPWQVIHVFDDDTTTNVVCEGYAKAFQYLCDLDGGLTCYSVSGTMSGGTGAGGHMWNIVTLDGANYLVDVTNCDEGTIGNPDQLFLKGMDEITAASSYSRTIGNRTITFKYYDGTEQNTSNMADLFGTSILTLSEADYSETEAIDISTATVTQTNILTYTGEEQTPEFEVVLGGTKLTEDTDYEVTVEAQTKAGTYEAKITGIGAYTGEVTAEWSIVSNIITITENDLENKESGIGWRIENGNLILDEGYIFTIDEICKLSVKNSGTIKDGIFYSTIDNRNVGTIAGGTYINDVNNYGTISGGTFPTSEGFVYNYAPGVISGGDFTAKVYNYSTITGGTFNEVDNDDLGTIALTTDADGGYSAVINKTVDDGKVTVDGAAHTHNVITDCTDNGTNHTKKLYCEDCPVNYVESEIDEDHSAVYTASGSTITAACACGKEYGSLTIKAPTDLAYNGSAKEATVTGTIDGVDTPTVEYYIDAVKLNFVPTQRETYTAKITVGDATAEVEFTIGAKDILGVTVTETPLEYTGEAQWAGLVLTDGDYTLVKDTDYAISGVSSATNAGTYNVTITGKNNYTGTLDTIWTIEKADITNCNSFYDENGADIEFTKEYDGTTGFDTSVVKKIGVEVNGGAYVELSSDDFTLTIDTDDANVGTGKYATAVITLSDEMAKNFDESIYEIDLSNFAEITARPLTVKINDKGIIDTAETVPTADEIGCEITSGTIADGQTFNIALSYETTPVAGTEGTHKVTGDVTVTDADSNDVTANYNITVTDGSLTITKHIHEWSYTASGAKITATCANTDGGCIGTTAVVELVAPENPVYDGSAKAVTVDGTIDGVTIPAVEYSGECTNAGTYTATLTIDNAKAELKFEITKADPVFSPSFAGPSIVYDTTSLDEIEITSGANVAGEITFDGVTALEVGTKEYTVIFTPTDSVNYNTATGTVTINAQKDAVNSIAVNTAPKTTYTYGEKFDPSGLVITATYLSGKTEDVKYADKPSEFSFTPDELTVDTDHVTVKYAEKEEVIEITVAPATPDFTIPANLKATYGNTLADITLTTGWNWDEPSTSVGDVGTKTFPATYDSSDKNYTTVTKDISVAVSPKTISIESATVNDKVYDRTTNAIVNEVTFDGVLKADNVDYTATGTFADKNAGEDKSVTVKVTVTSENYTLDSNTFTATATINKADPEVTTPATASAVTDQPLSKATLPEGWVWDNPNTVPEDGQTYGATYTPDDTTNYNTLTAKVKVTVSDCTHPETTVDIKASTCTEDGLKTTICKICDETVSTEVIPASHTWNTAYTVDAEATCTTDGQKSIHCSKCTAIKPDSEVVIPASHSWNSDYTIDTEATCTTDGEKSIHCAKCDEIKPDSAAAIPAAHDWKTGYSYDETHHWIECNNCDEIKDKSEHAGGNASSVHRATCSTCGKQYGEMSDPYDKPAEFPNNGNMTVINPVIPGVTQPQIMGENGRIGWNAISDELVFAQDGDTVTVDMNGITKLPKSILEDIAGRNIDLVLDMGSGITWTINGETVTKPQNVDMRVSKNVKRIPVDIIDNVTGDNFSMEISLAHNGKLGFEAMLTISLGKKYNDNYANLYYYNPIDKAMEFIDCDLISKGEAQLIFGHASDYAIVIDEEALGDDVSSAAGVTAESKVMESETAVSVVFALPLVLAAGYVLRKKLCR